MSVWLCAKCFSDNVVESDTEFVCAECGSDEAFKCDDLCVEVVQLLNRNGYRTVICCEGHFATQPRHPRIRLCTLSVPDALLVREADGGGGGGYVRYVPPPEARKDRWAFNAWKVRLWETLTRRLRNDLCGG